MKLTLIITTALASVAFAFMAFTNYTPEVTVRTEEYAIISVIQDGKRNYISTTVGSLPTEEKEFEKEKADKKNDLSPIIKELERLNEQGFYLLNGSNAVVPYGQSRGGDIFYTFIMKRKIRK
ncbi:MAG: hypothetical protein OSB25_12895 [Salibacteraceae bacterium]|nr:hypothetical protein [Salibacteraceae bacterium]|tara:strand:+ start:17677 stop:18042 length:366 start_codon:yes stop_codon:yes gene_type:complete